jgi:hypothetical protein
MQIKQTKQNNRRAACEALALLGKHITITATANGSGSEEWLEQAVSCLVEMAMRGSGAGGGAGGQGPDGGSR